MIEADVKILNALMRACSLGELCTYDVVRRLERRAAVDGGAILAKLKEDGYVDDARYAGAFARDKSALAGWGPARIRTALRLKGIDESLIGEALNSVDSDVAEKKMRTVLENKWKTLSRQEDGSKKQAKFIRFALSRGYSYTQAIEFYDSIRTNKRD